MKEVITKLIIGILLIVSFALVLLAGGIIFPCKKKQLLTPDYSGGIILEVNYRGLIQDKLYIIKLNNKIYKVRPYDIDKYYAGDTIK